MAGHLPFVLGLPRLQVGPGKEEIMKTCPDCGACVPDDTYECPDCGYEFDDAD